MYNELLQAIKTKLEQEFKGIIKSVFIMGSGFNHEEEIKDFALFAPCFGIGIESIPTNTRNNSKQLESMVSFSLFLINSSNNKKTGEMEIETYDWVEKLELLIMEGDWGIKRIFSTEQESIIAKPFNGPLMYKNKIWVWEINWKQRVLLGKDMFEAEEQGELPKNWTAKTDITGDGKTDEVVDFEQLENQYKTQTKR